MNKKFTMLVSAILAFVLITASFAFSERASVKALADDNDTVETTLADSQFEVSDQSIKVKETKMLDYKINQTNSDVSFKSSDEGVVKVDNKGNITGVSAGTATVTVTIGNQSKSCVVTVKNDYKILIVVILIALVIGFTIGNVTVLVVRKRNNSTAK